MFRSCKDTFFINEDRQSLCVTLPDIQEHNCLATKYMYKEGMYIFSPSLSKNVKVSMQQDSYSRTCLEKLEQAYVPAVCNSKAYCQGFYGKS